MMPTKASHRGVYQICSHDPLESLGGFDHTVGDVASSRGRASGNRRNVSGRLACKKRHAGISAPHLFLDKPDLLQLQPCREA